MPSTINYLGYNKEKSLGIGLYELNLTKYWIYIQLYCDCKYKKLYNSMV